MFLKSQTVFSGTEKENLINDLLETIAARFPKSDVSISQKKEKNGTITICFEVSGENLVQVCLP
ncbi:hypothetical protein [uncultured Photobacterium sp.]|uniref:hypothetical protein n=1 Tax=uncultured Photobacterium sp. TaxID=173973 RepID=UPI002636A520|nr:hypothetical protein [uncultured Photobacterium sp.]